MLQRRIWFLIGFVIILTACNINSSSPAAEQSPVPPAAAEATALPALTNTPVPTMTPSPVPATATLPPTATITPRPADLAITPDDVIIYPVPYLVSGDRVTFQLLPYVPDSVEASDVTARILVDDVEVVNQPLNDYNLGGDVEGLFKWVWDTAGLAGTHHILVMLDPENRILIGDENPDNNQLALTITVHERTDTAEVSWITAENTCCIIHTVSGTAAARDLTTLLTMVDAAIQQASDKLQEELTKKLEIYFVDKVIGQGGYAGSAMVISYLDRNYAGGGLHHVLAHEAAHVLDRQFAPQRIIFLAEGLAVWVSGGHFKTDDLNQRSLALLESGNYVPLAQLIDDFYTAQHEASYSQAAGFITYLIDTYGWPVFQDFYSDVTADDGATLAEAVDLNLQIYYAKTLAEMEAEWLTFLESLRPDRTAVTDLLTTIRYYDVMRHYQTAYDPTAYFLTAWLPIPQEVQEQGNIADLVRHPQEEINITLEVMLQAADIALRYNDYNRANVILDSVTRVLNNDGNFIDPLALSYRNIVRTAHQLGYEVQKVDLSGNQATVSVTSMTRPTLQTLYFALEGRDWVLSH